MPMRQRITFSNYSIIKYVYHQAKKRAFNTSSCYQCRARPPRAQRFAIEISFCTELIESPESCATALIYIHRVERGDSWLEALNRPVCAQESETNPTTRYIRLCMYTWFWRVYLCVYIINLRKKAGRVVWCVCVEISTQGEYSFYFSMIDCYESLVIGV